MRFYLNDRIWLENDPDGVLHDAGKWNGLDEEHFREFPHIYFQAPRWAVWILTATYWMFVKAQHLCYRWKPAERE